MSRNNKTPCRQIEFQNISNQTKVYKNQPPDRVKRQRKVKSNEVEYLDTVIDDYNVELLEEQFDVYNVGKLLDLKQTKSFLRNIERRKPQPVVVKKLSVILKKAQIKTDSNGIEIVDLTESSNDTEEKLTSLRTLLDAKLKPANNTRNRQPQQPAKSKTPKPRSTKSPPKKKKPNPIEEQPHQLCQYQVALVAN